MPAILDRLVRQLHAKGYKGEAAMRIAVSSLQKSGNLKKGSTEATAKGKARGMMTPGERARDRASKRSGHHPLDYIYNSHTNRATLRSKKR